MNRYLSKVTALALVMGVVMLLLPFCIKADAVNPVLEVSNYAGMDDLCDKVNNLSQDLAGFDFLLTGQTNEGVDTISVNMVEYKSERVSSQDRRDIMELTLVMINDSSNIAGQTKTRLYNFVASQDTATSSLVRQLSTDVSADFATAYSWFKPFSGGVSTVLGFLALAIFTTLTLMIVFDLAFLTIPLVQYALSKSDDTKAKLISNEAWMAVQEAEKDSTNSKTYLGIYFKKKTGQLILISVCLLYLITGKIFSLVGYFINAYQGFLID